MLKTINLTGGRNPCDSSILDIPADDPRGWTTDFRLLDSVPDLASILSVTVDGVAAELDVKTPMPDAVTVRLATAPAPGASVSITYQSGAI